MKSSLFLNIVQVSLSLSPLLASSASNDDIANIKNTVAVLQQTLESTVEELRSVKDELFAVKTELQSTSAQLISVKSDLNTFEKKYENETKAWKMEFDQMATNLTRAAVYLSHANGNVGFLVSSTFGDNGEDHIVSFLVTDETNLKFSQVTLNKGNVYSMKTGTMTAPVTGVYLIWVDINMHTGDMAAKLVKSQGSEIIMEQQSANGRVAFSTPVYLTKGKQVSARIAGNNYIMKNTNASIFGGVLLREF